MKRISCFLIVVLILFVLQSCKKEKGIEGLWVVDQVTVANKSMTPIAKWTRFNSDGTQVSGNGWLQHSWGTWQLNKDSLSVIDVNGIQDQTGPFQIEILESEMNWRRIENGEEVRVSFKRVDEIPQSDRTKLFGLWKLISAYDQGNDISAIVNPDGKAMLQLSWDQMYIQHNLPKGKNYGIYRIHAHKPEIQLVNYGSESSFSFWNFTLNADQLKLISSDEKSEMNFERIHKYLN